LNIRNKVVPILIILASIIITIILAVSKKDEEKKKIEPYVPNIQSFLVKSQDLRLHVNSEGHITSKTAYPLTSELYGKTIFLSDYFYNNLAFEKGDTLLIIDSTDYRIARINAKFRLDEAKLELLKQEAISERSRSELSDYKSDLNANDLAKNKPQLELAKSLLKAAQANYEKSELDLTKTVIAAPFNGRLIDSKINLGQYIAPNVELAMIYDIDKMMVRLPLSIDDLDLLGLNNLQNKGNLKSDEILIELSASIGDTSYTVNANYIGSSGNIDRFSQKIYINGIIDDFIDMNLPVDNNLFFSAKIYGPSYKSVFSIPNIAIHNDSYVYVVENEKIFKRNISILKKYDDVSIIRSGLNDGDIINLTNLDYYVEGMRVKVVKN